MKCGVRRAVIQVHTNKFANSLRDQSMLVAGFRIAYKLSQVERRISPSIMRKLPA